MYSSIRRSDPESCGGNMDEGAKLVFSSKLTYGERFLQAFLLACCLSYGIQRLTRLLLPSGL